MDKKSLVYSISIACLLFTVNSIATTDNGHSLKTHNIAPVLKTYDDCYKISPASSEHICVSPKNDIVVERSDDTVKTTTNTPIDAFIPLNTNNEETRRASNGGSRNGNGNGNGSGNDGGNGGGNGNGGSGGSNSSGSTGSSSNSLSTGAKIGIGVGVGLGVIGIIAGVVSFFFRCCGRIRRFQNIRSKQGRARDIENQQPAKDMYYAPQYSRPQGDSGTPLVEAPTSISPGFYSQSQERQQEPNELPT